MRRFASPVTRPLTRRLTQAVSELGGSAPFSMLFPASSAVIDADFANNQYNANGGTVTLASLLTQQIVTATPTFVLNADGTYSLNSGGTQSLRRSTGGLLIDDDRTNSARYSRDLTQVANWTKTNITVAKNQLGITGAANTGNLLTCSVAGGTVLQTLVATSRPWRQRVFIKRTGGTGIVELTLDNATFNDITSQLSNGVWVRVTTPDQTLTNPTFGIRMQGVGDTIVVDCFDMVGDNVVTEYGPCSPTTTASIKTWRDRPAAYNTDSSAIAAYLKSNTVRCVYAEVEFRQAGAIFATDGDFSCSIGSSNASSGALVTANGGNISTYSMANVNKVMVWRTAGETGICLNGGAIARGAGGAPDPAHTHTDFGTNGAGNLSMMGRINRLIFFNAVPADAQIIASTTLPPGAQIDGTGQIGTRLWSNGVAPFQWYRDGVAIGGETLQNHMIVSADDTKSITCIAADGLPSNAIVGTWPYQTFTGPFTLDMDAENLRYWFSGARYTEAAFEALPWTPALGGSLINKTFSNTTEPFPGFNQPAYAFICIESTTDNNADSSLVDFSDGTTTNWAAVQNRWSPNTSRMVVINAGATQVATTGTATMVTGTRYTIWGKFKANNFVYSDPVNGLARRDLVGTLPSVTMLKTGVQANGTGVSTGAINRVAVSAADTPELEVHYALDKTQLTLDTDPAIILENDGVDARDIFGDGFACIVNSNQDGRIAGRRQTSRGKFTFWWIKSTTVVNAKVEGVCFLNMRGDGKYQVANCDQVNNEIRIYEPTIPGNYSQSDWPLILTITGKSNIQDILPITMPADAATGLQTLFYAYEGGSGGNGGVGKLRWGGSSLVDTLINQHSGAWGLAATLFSNGDLLFSARNGTSGHNPGATPGVYRLTQAGVKSTIVAGTDDNLRVTIGDFFGLGNEDVANITYDGTTKAFSVFNSAAAWAETVVNHTAETTPPGTFPTGALNYGVHNLLYKANGRDALLLFGNGRGSVWHWDGVSAWGVAQRWDDLAAGHKSDDTIVRMNITRRLKPDIVCGDSINNQLVVLALTT